jgi:hypothetical protein
VNKAIMVFLLLATLCLMSFFGCEKKETKTDATTQYLYQSSAVSIKNDIKLLTLLRANENEKAIKILERLVDVNLVNLSTIKSIDKSETDTVLEAVTMAKDYRKNSSWKVDPNLAKSVEKTLGLVSEGGKKEGK